MQNYQKHNRPTFNLKKFNNFKRFFVEVNFPDVSEFLVIPGFLSLSEF